MSSSVLGWDAADWVARFSARYVKRQEMRMDVIAHTLQMLKRPELRATISNLPATDQCKQAVKLDARDLARMVQERDAKIPPQTHQTVIEVWNEDCLLAARRASARFGPNASVMVLNMASPKRPGGGYLTGAGAQEENLFRRSNYSEVLSDSLYRLQITQGAYNPEVHVFRGAEAEGYPLLVDPQLTQAAGGSPVLRAEVYAFVAVPAIPNPPLVGGHLARDAFETTEMKATMILQTAAAYGHDVLVLSAMGCGAFRNPPEDIARIFANLLVDPRFATRFRAVIFAIIEDHNSHDNFGTFDRVLAPLTKQSPS